MRHKLRPLPTDEIAEAATRPYEAKVSAWSKLLIYEAEERVASQIFA